MSFEVTFLKAYKVTGLTIKFFGIFWHFLVSHCKSNIDLHKKCLNNPHFPEKNFIVTKWPTYFSLPDDKNSFQSQLNFLRILFCPREKWTFIFVHFSILQNRITSIFCIFYRDSFSLIVLLIFEYKERSEIIILFLLFIIRIKDVNITTMT